MILSEESATFGIMLEEAMMTSAQLIVSLAAVALAIRYGFILFRMERIGSWIAATAARNAALCRERLANGADRPFVLVVVPALRELDTLGRTLTALKSAIPQDIEHDFALVVVTTEKERAERAALVAAVAAEIVDRSLSTQLRLRLADISADLPGRVSGLMETRFRDNPADVAKRAAEMVNACPFTWDLNSGPAGEHVRWLHFPNATGNMASQLNYALRQLLPDVRGREQTAYFVSYNADTTPDPNSLRRLHDLLIAERLPAAAQLMAVPMLNFLEHSSAYAAGAAIYQSRWALGYEFAMLRQSAVSLQSLYHYCRGHGMVFRLDYLLGSGGFDENTALEDIFEGFKLSCEGLRCYPVPVLEWTESPTEFRTVVHQKRFWFSGMLDLWKYPSMLPPALRARTSRWRLCVLMAIGFYREIFTWLAGPSLVALLAVSSLLSDLVLIVALPVANAVLSTFLVLANTPPAYRPQRLLSRGVMACIWGTLIYSLTRNLGPLSAVVSKVFRRSSTHAQIGTALSQDNRGIGRD
jgi:cellulose synthase/poly-beta-1,6-N-acetylglucosamine synthase-like glycosyltransferase